MHMHVYTLLYNIRTLFTYGSLSLYTLFIYAPIHVYLYIPYTCVHTCISLHASCEHTRTLLCTSRAHKYIFTDLIHIGVLSFCILNSTLNPQRDRERERVLGTILHIVSFFYLECIVPSFT